MIEVFEAGDIATARSRLNLPRIRQTLLYDRKLLLSQEKRNQVLALWEVQKYGLDSFSDADYLCMYGLRPAEWYERGIRLLARTAVECTRDKLGDLIGEEIAAVAQTATSVSGSVVIDPFAGSGNTLFWIVHKVAGSKGIGFELDDAVFASSKKNISVVGADIEFIHEDFEAGIKRLSIPSDELIVVYVAPPWGEALSEDLGLDLRRTKPPVREIVDLVDTMFPNNRILCAMQIYERVDKRSLEELKERFDWSAVHVYRLNAPGKNHGILIGTKRWN